MTRNLLLFAMTLACAAPAACQPAPSSPPVVMPAPTPAPTLADDGNVFYYIVAGKAVMRNDGNDACTHKVTIDRYIVQASTPPGWTTSYAGPGAWFQYQAQSSARFVIYPERDVERAYRKDWRRWHEKDPNVTILWTRSLSGPRHAVLYAYSSDKGARKGIVYALENGDGTHAGIIVHGEWPTDLHNLLVPVAVAAADNAVTTSLSLKKAPM